MTYGSVAHNFKTIQRGLHTSNSLVSAELRGQIYNMKYIFYAFIQRTGDRAGSKEVDSPLKINKESVTTLNSTANITITHGLSFFKVVGNCKFFPPADCRYEDYWIGTSLKHWLACQITKLTILSHCSPILC